MVDIKENYKCDLGVIGLTLWSDWHLIKFSLQYYPWIKDDSHENRGNDHQGVSDFSTNSSSQYHRECIENDKEKTRTDLKG